MGCGAAWRSFFHSPPLSPVRPPPASAVRCCRRGAAGAVALSAPRTRMARPEGGLGPGGGGPAGEVPAAVDGRVGEAALARGAPGWGGGGRGGSGGLRARWRRRWGGREVQARWAEWGLGGLVPPGAGRRGRPATALAAPVTVSDHRSESLDPSRSESGRQVWEGGKAGQHLQHASPAAHQLPPSVSLASLRDPRRRVVGGGGRSGGGSDGGSDGGSEGGGCGD